jgi:hypothetical protein
MKKAGPWTRFIVWLRALIGGRTRREAFLDVRLRQLRAHIRSVSPGLTGFETRDLSPRFARKLYDVYLKTHAVADMYRAFATDKVLRQAAYAWYVEERSDDPRRSIDEFVPEQEMEEIFAQTGQTEEISKKLSLRLNDYIRAIPESFLAQLEEQARLHVFLGRLTSFPFASLLRYFNCVLADPPDPHYPTFEGAPVMLTLDLLEKLYATFALVRSCAPEYDYASEPVSFYLSAISGAAVASARGGRPPAPKDPARYEAELTRIRADIAALGHEIDSFGTAVPLLDLLRYFRRDPWYQLVFNAPHLYLRSLYFAALKARLAAQLEERLGEVKERVIGRKIEELLKGQKLVELSWYRVSPDFDLGDLSLPVFSCVRSLTLVHNFLLQHFKGAMQEVAQIVSTTALANNRIIQSRLAQGMGGLEALEPRIVLFDRSLSPDADDGKQLARFRDSVAGDLLLQKSYRAFVQQKDREARELVDKAREHLGAVRGIFDEIRRSSFDSTRSLLKTIHPVRGRPQTLGQLLNSRVELMGNFVGLLDQLLELEKGL